MREAAAPAVAAVRSIAQISWRVDMAWRKPSITSAVRVAEPGKARVNRMNASLLAEAVALNQGSIRSALLSVQ